MRINLQTLIFIGFSAIVLSSCGGDKAAELQKQVFAVHDEVMPKMDDIYTYRKDLLEVKSNAAASQKSLSEADKSEISKVCDSLTVAQIAMEDWMHGYKADIETASTSQKISYFEAELPKIQKVRSTMLRIVELGKATCAKFPKKQTDEKTDSKPETAPKTDKTEVKTVETGKEKAAKTAPKTDVKTSTDAPKTVEKIEKAVTDAPKTVEKVEKTEKTDAAAQPTVKAVQPRVSAGATKVPR